MIESEMPGVWQVSKYREQFSWTADTGNYLQAGRVGRVAQGQPSRVHQRCTDASREPRFQARKVNRRRSR